MTWGPLYIDSPMGNSPISSPITKRVRPATTRNVPKKTSPIWGSGCFRTRIWKKAITRLLNVSIYSMILNLSLGAPQTGHSLGTFLWVT